MILSVTLVGARELVTRLDSMPVALHSALLRKMTELSLRLQAHIQRDKLSGQVLNVRSGALRRSIHSFVEDLGDLVSGGARSSGDVKYAAIHEFGGRTKAHDIYPRKADALAFMGGEGMIFAKVVHHPGSVMPERSFMRTSLQDLRPAAEAEMKQTVVLAMMGVVR